MPRKGPASRRDLMPDPVYRSVVVTQVVNKVLQRGKRSIAEKIVYDALADMEKKSGGDPVAVLKRAVENVRPALEVRSRRVGGATYQVPVEVRPRRATTLAVRWIVGYSRQRREKTMAERLANELLDASNGLGGVDQAEGRPSEDGGVEQGIRPLPVVMRLIPGLFRSGVYAFLADLVGPSGRRRSSARSGASRRPSRPSPCTPRGSLGTWLFEPGLGRTAASCWRPTGRFSGAFAALRAHGRRSIEVRQMERLGASGRSYSERIGSDVPPAPGEEKKRREKSRDGSSGTAAEGEGWRAHS